MHSLILNCDIYTAPLSHNAPRTYLITHLQHPPPQLLPLSQSHPTSSFSPTPHIWLHKLLLLSQMLERSDQPKGKYTLTPAYFCQIDAYKHTCILCQ